MSQSENMDAINVYFLNTKAITPAAQAIQNDWMVWFPRLSFWEKNVSGDTYDEARARRNNFNLANAASPQEQAQVLNVINTGITTEQSLGKSDSEVDAARKRVASKQVSVAQQGHAYPTLKKGMKGKKEGDDLDTAIKKWQSIVGVKPDGNFGSGTEAATKKWQKGHQLKDDGIVGQASWAKALPPPETPAAIKSDAAIVAAIPAAVFSPPPRASVVASRAAQAVAKAPAPAAPKAQAITSHVAVAQAKNAGPAAVPGVKAVGETAPTAVQEAGMMSWLGKLPTWAKVLLGISIAGGAAAIAKKNHDALNG